MSELDLITQVRLKCRYEGEIRLVVVPVGGAHKPDYLSLHRSLSNDYGFDVALKYSDTDGDVITLASQNDLENLIVSTLSTTSQSVDIFVSESLQLPEIKKSSNAPRYLNTPATPTSASSSLLSKVPIIPPIFPSVGAPPSAGSDTSYRTATGNKEVQIKWKRGEVIGQGAFGVVYLGLNIESGELLAVKQMALDEVSTKELSQLENEINLLRSLRHPNIVRYIGTEITPNSLSIFLEYIPGGSLKNLIEKFGYLEENVVRSYTRQLLLGLEYLHRNGIAHRDIKGANCLVSNDGVVKLADFGASRHWRSASVPGASVSQKNGDIKGTPSWMAPELVQEHGAAISWRKADVWSLACTTLEMTTGVPPWAQFNNHVTILYHLACTEALPEYPPDASIELITFLNTCLQREPARRPDITSLLMHSFVSGAGWTPSAARPSTVSTTPAWAWTARDTPQTQRAPLLTNRNDAPSTDSSRAGHAPILVIRSELITARDSSLLAQRGISPGAGNETKKSNNSLDRLSTSSIAHDMFDSSCGETSTLKMDLSDCDSVTSNAVPKRRLRSKDKASKSASKTSERRRKSSDQSLSESLQSSTHIVGMNALCGADELDVVFDESKGSDDWVRSGSNDEILEEIEESFEDSLELVELSNDGEMLGADEEGLVEERASSKANKDEAEIKNDTSVVVRKNRANAQPKSGNLTAPTLRERRQWTGSIDVAKANNIGPHYAESGRDLLSPPTDIGNPYGFKLPPQPSSKSNQRGHQFLATPFSAQEKSRRNKSRSSSEAESGYSFNTEDPDEHKEVYEKCRLSFSTLEGVVPQVLCEHQGQVTKLFVAKKNQVLLSASFDGTVRMWTMSSNDSKCVLDTSFFTPATGALDAAETPKRVRGPDERSPSFSAAAVKVTHLWADDNCETVWGGCVDFNFRVWSGNDGKPLRFLKGHEDTITCVDGFSSSNPVFASGSSDRTIRMFDVRSRKPQTLVLRGHTDAVFTLKIAEGGRTIISGSKDKTIKIFDTRTGRMRASLEKHFGTVSLIRMIPDLQLNKGSDTHGFVSGGRDSMINVWNLNGEHLASQVAHRGSMNRISGISEGVSSFITTGADSVVKVWDARRIKMLSEIKTGAVSEVLHQQNAFISASVSGLLKVWTPSIESRQHADLAQHNGPCTDLVSGTDFIASSSKSGQIFRWIGPSSV